MFGEMKLPESSSAALWKLKGMLWIWRAAAGWIHASSQLTLGTVFWLDSDQTQADCLVSRLRKKTEAAEGRSDGVMLTRSHVVWVCWCQDQLDSAGRAVGRGNRVQTDTSWGNETAAGRHIRQVA